MLQEFWREKWEIFIEYWDGQRKDGGVTNKYIDVNEPLSPFPLCVAIMNAQCSWRCPFFRGLYIRPDTPPVRPDLSWGDQTPHFISWPLLRSPCLFLSTLLSLPLALALPVFFSVSAGAPWVIISPPINLMSSVSSCWVHSHTRIPHIPPVEQQQDQGEKSLRHESITAICQVHYTFLDTLEIIVVDLSPADIMEQYSTLISGLGRHFKLILSWNK